VHVNTEREIFVPNRPVLKVSYVPNGRAQATFCECSTKSTWILSTISNYVFFRDLIASQGFVSCMNFLYKHIGLSLSLVVYLMVLNDTASPRKR